MKVFGAEIIPPAAEWQKWQVRLIGLLTLFYVVIQILAIHSEGFRAQDFLSHSGWIGQAAAEGAKFITIYGENRTNPPLYHYLGGILARITPNHCLVVLAYCNLAFSLIGIFAAYQIICSLIVDRWLRAACFGAFILLPCYVIQSIVIASDALTTPAVLVFVWALIVICRPARDREFLRGCILASLALSIGVMAKFTFLSEVLGALVFIAIIGSRGILSRSRVVVAVIIIVLPAAITGWWQLSLYRAQSKYNLGIAATPNLERYSNGPMNLRSVLFPRPADRELLEAPQYYEIENGKPSLLESNKHSFPGLLHLGAFSDLLNAYQFDPFHTYFGLRYPFGQSAMALAVKAGLWISILSVVGIVSLTIVAVRSIWKTRDLEPVPLALAISSLAWFLNIALFLPLVNGPYMGGYWHPRLVTPAIILFIISGFYWVQRRNFRVRAISPALFIMVLLQMGLHASFLWPRSENPSEYVDTNRDIVRSRPEFHVEYLMPYSMDGPAEAPFFRLGAAAGIVVRRNKPAIPVESYILSLTFSPGPGNPDPARRIAIHLPDGRTQEFSFQATETVSVPVSLGQGRSLISIELLSPKHQDPTSFPDPRNLLVTVSGVRFMDPSSGSASRRTP